jgi:hypothetical protein
MARKLVWFSCGALCIAPEEKFETVSKYENLDSV